MKRREFVNLVLKSGAAFGLLPLVSCAPRTRSGTKEGVDFVTMHDLIVERHDNPKYDYKKEKLDAEFIMQNKPKSFTHTEKSHEHTYTFEPHHYERLKRGETVVVTTNVVNGHTHSFRASMHNYIKREEPLKIPLGPAPEELEGVVPLTPEQMFKMNV